MTARTEAPRGALVADVVRAHRFVYANETELQQAVAEVLAGAGWPVEREVRLGAWARVDLVVGRVGVEVKVAGRWEPVLRQLQRYAASERLDELVLVTTRVRHVMPERVGGKPVTVARLGWV